MKFVFKILQNNLFEILIFLFWIVVYGFTSSRSVVQGDTGEFLGAAAVHGVSHASGYPLLSLISRIAFLLPFTNPTWQVNVTSALFAALALVFTFKIVKLLTNNTPSALCSALALGTYETFWFYALVVQVHTLQVFLLSLLFYFLLLAMKKKKHMYMYLAGFFFGLGVSNNYTIIFALPSIFLTMWYLRKEITIKNICITILSSVLGLLPYTYIICAASTNPPINWGRIRDIQSFLYFFFRLDYGGGVNLTRFEPPLPFIYSSFVYYMQSIIKTSWYIVPFVGISLISLLRKNKNYFILFSCFVLIGPFAFLFLNLPIHNIVYETSVDQFITYSFIFLCIFAGIGLNILFEKLKLKNMLILVIAIILFFITPFFYTLQKVQLDNNQVTAITTQFELSELPQNSILLTWYDSLYLPSLYWQYVKHYRQDIKIINVGLTGASWYRNNLKDQYPDLAKFIKPGGLDFNNLCAVFAKKGELFVYPWYPEEDSYFNKNCVVIPYGLMVKVVQKNNVPSVDTIKSFNDKSWLSYSSLLPHLDVYKNRYARTRETLYYVAEQLSYIGLYYELNSRENWAYDELKLARQISADEVGSITNESAILYARGDYTDAIPILNQGIMENPAYPKLYKNLGFVYLKLNQQDKAYENFNKYLGFNPTDDPDLAKINNFMALYTVNKNL